MVHCEIFFRVLNHINSIRKVGTHGKWTEKKFKKVGGWRVKSEVILKLCRLTSFFAVCCCIECVFGLQYSLIFLSWHMQQENAVFFKKQENHKPYMIEENKSCSYLVIYIGAGRKTKHPKWWIYAYSKCRLREKWQQKKPFATEIKFPWKVVFCINIFCVLLKKPPTTPKIHKYKNFHKALWWKLVDYQTFKSLTKCF